MTADASSEVDQVEGITEGFLQAHAASCALPRPSARYELDEVAAYEVQRRFVKGVGESRGLGVIGYKISLVGAEEQGLFRTDEPAYGRLWLENVFPGYHTFDLSVLPYPLLIEPEIAFRLLEDITADITLAGLAEAAEIAPAVELPALMYRDWVPTVDFLDLICANALSGYLVLGDFTEMATTLLGRSINVEVYNGDRILVSSDTTEGMGNPLLALEWLRRKLQASGECLRKGQVVASGTLGGARRLRPGEYRADFSELGQVQFAAAP